MHGKTVVITGGNAGIGLETAVGLAKAGARVVIAARNPSKAAAAVADVSARAQSALVEHLPLDLASLASIREFCALAESKLDRIDVLVNNAGVVMLKRRQTADGFEMTFGVNHLGHFALTQGLLPLLKASAQSRIVTVASDAHKGARRGLDFDDLQLAKHRYGPMKAYCRSKLANILFNLELSKRLAGTGVDANCVHPGAVATRLARDGDAGWLGEWGMRLGRRFFLTPEEGARTSIYVASDPGLQGLTGHYYVKCLPTSPTKWATDEAAARRLWQASEALVA